MKKSPTRFLRRVDNKFTSASLYLDFQNMTTMDSRVTFTRASNATYFDGSGILRTAGNNVPRFDVNPTTLDPLGLLIEEQRTNLLLASEDFTGAGKGSLTSVVGDTTVAPDGYLTADTVSCTGTTVTENFLYKSATVSVVSESTYTFSVWLKADAEKSIALRLSNATNTDGADATVTVTTQWQRFEITRKFTATSTAVRGYVFRSNEPVTFEVWGAQLEAGAFATSYIPTTTAAATRNADAASMTGTNFSSWYRADEGTLYAESNTAKPSSSATCFAVNANDGTSSNFIATGRFSTPPLQDRIDAGGVAQASLSYVSPYTPYQFYKTALSYKVNDFAGVANGGTVQTDTSGNIPVVNRLVIGAFVTTLYLNGTIRKIAYYPTRLSNEQLQALTR